MFRFLPKIMLAMLFMSITPQKLDGAYEQWCIADEQSSDKELQGALDWACGPGGADCWKIQVNQGCYYPNSVKDHASFAFNSYYQRFKHKGGSCFFKGAAITTEIDPSQGNCRYEYYP